MSQLPPVVKWLLLSNAAIFLLDYLVLPKFFNMPVDDHGNPPLVQWGAFSVDSAISKFRLWEFVTFQFLHGSLGHVLFNCIGLYFFGPWLERWWGSLKFLVFYLLCGGAGAAFFSVLAMAGVLPMGELVGASAGIYGILIGVAFIAPGMRVTLLFPPVELSIRQLAIGLMVFSAGAILLKIGGNEGGEAGHLGGAILGFILMRYPRLLGGPPEFIPMAVRAERAPVNVKLRPRAELHLHDDPEVDAILDKISSEGFQNLTESERETLRIAAERQNSKP